MGTCDSILVIRRTEVGKSIILYILFNFVISVMIDKVTLSLPDGLSICNPIEGDYVYRQKAESQFREFVKKTYDGLYKIETMRLGGRSSICVFCRLDIGILMDENHSAYYFVNEVERTPTTSLWSNTSRNSKSQSLIGTFGTTFAYVFHRHLNDVLNPNIVY